MFSVQDLDETEPAASKETDVTATLDLKQVLGEDKPVSSLETQVWEKARRLEHAAVTLEELEDRVRPESPDCTAVYEGFNRPNEKMERPNFSDQHPTR